MREWLASLLTASLVSVIAELLSPDGKMKRCVAFAISLLLLAVLLAPLFDLGEAEARIDELIGQVLPEEGEATDSAALSAAVSAAEKALAEQVSQALGIRRGSFEIALRYVGEGETPTLLGLTVRASDAETGERVRRYLESETALECEVIVS